MMSRHGYVDDIDDPLELGRWRGRVMSAIRGKRGQALLRDLLIALESMPEKRLIANELVDQEGACCALGAVAKLRQIDVGNLDPDDRDKISEVFDIARPLACEIMFWNDDFHGTPEARWKWVYAWVKEQLAATQKAT